LALCILATIYVHYSSVPAKSLAGKNVFEMTYFMLSGMTACWASGPVAHARCCNDCLYMQYNTPPCQLFNYQILSLVHKMLYSPHSIP